MAKIQLLENLSSLLCQNTGNRAIDEPFQKFKCDSAKR